jgi:dihydroorotase
MYIDAHVHCRDFEEKHKETIEHALLVAKNSGLSAIFDMPNTKPATIDRATVEDRLAKAHGECSPVFYGLYIGVTANPEQIREAVRLHKEYFPKPRDRVGVIGLKMFAGKSVGDLSVVDEESQMQVYRTLAESDYRGVLAVHCEKEALMKPQLWTPENPASHSLARPEESEINSIADQLQFAQLKGYRGHLHICHVSTPHSVQIVNGAKARGQKVSCGVTPHHLLLDDSMMEGPEGILYKVNPPLRNDETCEDLFESFMGGAIDILESDHAPHTLDEKKQKYMSGIPGLASWPDFMKLLEERTANSGWLNRMTYHNVNRIFGTKIKRLNLPVLAGIHLGDYAFDAYKELKAEQK